MFGEKSWTLRNHKIQFGVSDLLFTHFDNIAVRIICFWIRMFHSNIVNALKLSITNVTIWADVPDFTSYLMNVSSRTPLTCTLPPPPLPATGLSWSCSSVVSGRFASCVSAISTRGSRKRCSGRGRSTHTGSRCRGG